MKQAIYLILYNKIILSWMKIFNAYVEMENLKQGENDMKQYFREEAIEMIHAHMKYIKLYQESVKQ